VFKIIGKKRNSMEAEEARVIGTIWMMVQWRSNGRQMWCDGVSLEKRKSSAELRSHDEIFVGSLVH
jgi:hypothetical protein